MGDKQKSMKDLQSLRNIGPAAAARLYSIGIKEPGQVKRSNPKKLYERLKKKSRGRLDICVLYQIRGAASDKPWWKCGKVENGRRKNG